MNRYSSKEKWAATAIKDSRVLDVLRDYSPAVVSTIFVGFDVDNSDIDIICRYTHPKEFANVVQTHFGQFEQFYLDIGEARVLSRFDYDKLPFEIYAAPLPVEQQMGYQHYVIMERLSRIGGEAFQQAVRQKKRGGLKTEPTIASLLNFPGDPYRAVLTLNNWTDEQIEEAIASLKT